MALISPKWRECCADGSWFQQKEKTLRMKLASSLSVIWFRSLCAVVRETPLNRPPQTRQRRLTLQQFITSATSVRGLKSCDLSPFWVLFYLFFSCSGSSGGCLNTAEFAQVPEDGLNAACCIHCHALWCITWTSVATCLDTDLLCVSNMWIKWYWGKCVSADESAGLLMKFLSRFVRSPQSKQIRDFHTLHPAG